MPKRARALAASLVVLLATLAGAELVFRLRTPAAARAELHRLRQYLLSGEMRNYEARAYTVFQRPRSSSYGNSLGFGDREWPRTPTPGVPRILCMGGSTTESGNLSGAPGSYPRLLEPELEARTGRDFEVLNAGISGWSTAEMLVSWFLTLQDLAPDVLVLHEAVNDLDARFGAVFERDYSHWRRPIETRPSRGFERWLVRGSELYLRFLLRKGGPPDLLTASTYPRGELEPLLAEGKLPHATSLAFRRNIENVARSARAAGTLVVLMTMPTGPFDVGAFWDHGIAENNQHLRELCAEHGFVLVDAARLFEARPEMTVHFTDKVHLEGPGNQFKAELVADGLADWLAALPPEGAHPPTAQASVVPRARARANAPRDPAAPWRKRRKARQQTPDGG